MAEDENQQLFSQLEIYSFHNYDQLNQQNLNNQPVLQHISQSYEGNPPQQFQQQDSHQQYKIDEKMEQEMQLEEIDQNKQNQQQYLSTQNSQQHPQQQQILSTSHFNMQHHQQLQKSQPNQQQLVYSQQQSQQNLSNTNHKLSIPQSQSPHLNNLESNYHQAQNNYLKSEDAGRNYPLLANILDESQQNIKLNEFYSKNKVLQGLNCFMLLDNELPRHTASANNFSDDPNFYIGHIFEEKNKNGKYSENSVMSDNSHLQSSYQSPQQVSISQNQQINPIQQDQIQKQQSQTQQLNHQQQSQQHQQQQYQQQQQQQQKQQLQQLQQQQQQYQNQHSQQQQFIINSYGQNENQINQKSKEQSKLNDDQQFLNDYISGYLQENHPSQTHDGSNKGPSKNAFQRSSTSFLDKVTIAVDDFLDKQDPNEYPELKSGEDFLMTNLRNYIALELSFNQESSYFQKFLNSSYQIFLQRLKLLIEQKRMDSKTLLPFVCRFSIEMAEKLLQFIYKCDDKFTMKLFREQPFLSNDPNLIKKEFNAPTSPTTWSYHSQRFDSSLLMDDDFSSIMSKNLEDVRSSLINAGNEQNHMNSINSNIHQTSPIQPSQLHSNYKNDFLLYNQTLQNPNKQQVQQNNSSYSQQYEQYGMNVNQQQLNSQIQQQQQQQQQLLTHKPSNPIQQVQNSQVNLNDGIEEEDDQLPFPSQKPSFVELSKAKRVPWKKSEINELLSKYREYQQKIPYQVMEELGKKFNRSIQSIQSKVQKIRKNPNLQNTDMMSEYSLSQYGSNQSFIQNSSFTCNSQISNQTMKNIFETSNSSRSSNTSNIGQVHINNNQNQVNMMKIESKLKNCLYELENYSGTKNEILKKMKERFYQNVQGGQTSAWETSAKQLLSSSSFQRRKGVFQLKEDVQVTNIEANTDSSSSYKQKLIYILSQLPERKGTLEDIVSIYLKKFTNEQDLRKIKENIQKVLNQYSDCFDKSQSKTTYYLTPQEIQYISQEINSQNNNVQSSINQIDNQMSLQSTLQSRCSCRGSQPTRENGIHLPLFYYFSLFTYLLLLLFFNSFPILYFFKIFKYFPYQNYILIVIFYILLLYLYQTLRFYFIFLFFYLFFYFQYIFFTFTFLFSIAFNLCNQHFEVNLFSIM